YIGMKIVLSIAATVIFGIITLVALLIVMLPAGGAGALIFVLARNAGATWNPLTIALAAIAAVILAALLLFIIGMISVPSTVFFPAYSLYFFAERSPALRTRWYPVPPTPDT